MVMVEAERRELVGRWTRAQEAAGIEVERSWKRLGSLVRLPHADPYHRAAGNQEAVEDDVTRDAAHQALALVQAQRLEDEGVGHGWRGRPRVRLGRDPVGPGRLRSRVLVIQRKRPRRSSRPISTM